MLNKKLFVMVLPLLATHFLHANDPMNDPFFKDPFGDDIFKKMMQMQQNMDNMFHEMNNRMQQRSTRLVSPLGTYKLAGKNVFVDKGNSYELTTTIPENKENHIEINSENGVISITAKIIEKQENKTSNGYASSRSVRMYQQSMQVPKDADEATMKVAYKNGKLVISMNKKTSSKAKINLNPKKSSTAKAMTKENNTSKETNTTTKEKRTLNSDQDSVI